LPPFIPNGYLWETHKDKGAEKWEIYSWAMQDIMSKATGLPKDYTTTLKDKMNYPTILKGKITYEEVLKKEKEDAIAKANKSATPDSGNVAPDKKND
jgi:hypothetical protein